MKWEGWRALVYVDGGVRVRTRAGREVSDSLSGRASTPSSTVQVLAGTDVVGNVSREDEPAGTLADFVTNDNDPREDLEELFRPSAVLVGGARVAMSLTAIFDGARPGFLSTEG